MAESPSRRFKWIWVAIAGLCLAVGIDIGIRIGQRSPAAASEAAPADYAGKTADRPVKNLPVVETPPPGESAAPQKKAHEDAPRLPPPQGKLAELIHAGDQAAAAGDKVGAVALFAQAEAEADDPRRKEELAFRRLWLLYELGRTDEVRRVASEIAAHPTSEASKQAASELLGKLGEKGK